MPRLLEFLEGCQWGFVCVWWSPCLKHTNQKSAKEHELMASASGLRPLVAKKPWNDGVKKVEKRSPSKYMLKKKHRLTKNSFLHNSPQSRSFFDALMTLRVTKDPTNTIPKMAVVVSKKLTKTAVRRNRIRRRLHHAATPLLPKLSPGFLYVVHPKKETETVLFSELRESLRILLEKAGLLK